jgi:hypothetical protein
MDPVYGAVFASLLLGESLYGIQGWIGAGLITLAAATNALLGTYEANSNNLAVEIAEDRNDSIL